MTNLDSILKSRDISFPTKICTIKAMVFPVVMYRCESWTIKKGWAPKHCCFRILVLEKIFQVHWNEWRSNQSILKETDHEYSLEKLVLKLKLQYFGHLVKEPTHWKRPKGWQRLRTGADRGDRGDGWMTSLIQWTWAWASSEGWWRTGSLACCRPWDQRSLTWLSDWI